MPETSTVQLPLQRLSATLAASTSQPEERTAEITWYTGAAIRRVGWDGAFLLSFDMSPACVRMERFNSGRAPILNCHRDGAISDQIGVIEGASISKGIGHATARFSQRAEVTPIWEDIRAGIIGNISMGAQILKLKEITSEGDKTKHFLAVDWSPVEASIVPVGADADARIQASAEVESFECEIEVAATAAGEHSMEVVTTKTDATAAERDRILTLNQVGKAAKLSAELIDTHVRQGTTIEKFREVAINAMADASDVGGEINVHHPPSMMRDGRVGLVERMSEALACRFTGAAPSDAAREFAGARIVDLARVLCQQHGINVRHAWDSSEVIRLAHTTSDFPNLLQGTGARMLLQAYAASQPALKQVARRSSVADFRTKSIIRLGEAPALLEVNEHGEVTSGSRAEAAESYRARTYARIFGITRQALINDDLSAFADFTRAYGVAASQLEGKLLSDLLTSNPAMSDTKLLFSADHSNVSTGAGSALGIGGLSGARLAMRLMTGLDGTTVLDIPPVFLVVPAALETTGQQILVATNYSPAELGDVNPFQQALTLVVDPRLDAASTTAWYLFGSPATSPVLEYSYLGDQQGPIVETRPGWEMLGMEFRAVLDIGAGVIDFRGAHRAAGA